MNNITVTVELGESSRKLLETLLQEIRIISDTAEHIRLAVVEGKVLPTVGAKEEEAPAKVAEELAPVEEAPEAPAEQPVKTVELSDIQKKVVELSAAGKKAEVRDIITKYASRVSAIPADKTAEVWEKLTALEG